MTTNIYLLEDDVDVRQMFERELTRQHFNVTSCGTIAEFKTLINTQLPDVCILDLSLPDGDALTVLRDIIAELSIPSIVVSGRGALGDKILGLDLGADDYLVKPVDAMELSARVRTLLRRSEKRTPESNDNAPSEYYEFAGWCINLSTLQLTDPDGNDEMIGTSDARLLQAFMRSPGKVLSRDKLMSFCIEDHDDVFDRSIDTRISRLRKRLKENPKSPKLIRTIYGAGYVFTPKVITP